MTEGDIWVFTNIYLGCILKPILASRLPQHHKYLLYILKSPPRIMTSHLPRLPSSQISICSLCKGKDFCLPLPDSQFFLFILFSISWIFSLSQITLDIFNAQYSSYVQSTFYLCSRLFQMPLYSPSHICSRPFPLTILWSDHVSKFFTAPSHTSLC